MAPRTRSQKRLLASFQNLGVGPAGLAYLGSRGLAGDTVRRFFAEVPRSNSKPAHWPYAGRLVIMSLGPDDTVHDIAFRCIEHPDCKAVGCAKYLFLDGIPKRLWNARAVLDHGTSIDIAEGQLDAISLVACGLNAVGVAGSEGWKPHFHRLFGGFDTIRVWADGDPAGRHFAERVVSDIPTAEVMMVPPTEDINSLLVKKGPAAILALAEGKDTDSEDEPPF